MRNKPRNLTTGVAVPGGLSANSLGIIRCFGRRNIPVFYFDSEPHSLARFSKYITRRIPCLSLNLSDTDFIDQLLRFGRKRNQKTVLIPTGDLDALSISRHRQDLERYYTVILPATGIVEDFVQKDRFYRLLGSKDVAHPKTLPLDGSLPPNRIAGLLECPFLVKPTNSILFQKAFGQKCFVIYGPSDLLPVLEQLRVEGLDAVAQEIIPGHELYAVYLYLNRNSVPIALCGYDKLRHFPHPFGNGSLCQTQRRPVPIRKAIGFLTSMGYQGIAEVEFKKDVRDQSYKLIEINVRTTLQNRLPAGSGTDIDFVAYLDATGQRGSVVPWFREGILWIDDVYDALARLSALCVGSLRFRDFLRSQSGQIVRSVAALDDPLPLFSRWMHLFRTGFRSLDRHTIKKHLGSLINGFN